MKKYTVVALGIVICLTSNAFADEVTLDSQQEAFVSEAVPTIPTGLEGYVAVAHDWEIGLFPTTKGLIQFNIASLGSVLEVQNATLKLHMLTVSGPGEAEFLRAGNSWDEYTTTWNFRPAEDRGEHVFGNVVSAGLFEVDVTDIVVYYYPNNGFYIDVPDNGDAVDFQFASKEHSSPGNRPQLEITYTPGDAVSESEPGQSIVLDVASVSCGSADISFSLPASVAANLSIYDASGSLVKNISVNSGKHSLTWDGEAGVYFVRLETAGNVLTRKLVLTR